MKIRISVYRNDTIGELVREWTNVQLEEAGRIACNALLALGDVRVLMIEDHNPRRVIATHIAASEAPGSWRCGLCGFRGFWSGGLHCVEDKE